MQALHDIMKFGDTPKQVEMLESIVAPTGIAETDRAALVEAVKARYELRPTELVLDQAWSDFSRKPYGDTDKTVLDIATHALQKLGITNIVLAGG